MSNLPPSYDTATGSSAGAPSIQVTGSSSQNDPSKRKATDHHDFSDDEDGLLHPGMKDSDMKSFHDEERELPDGWLRLWDEKQHHHYYAEKATGRTIWVHPYDDWTYLTSLPDTHPANPNSAEAKAAKAHFDELHKQHQAEEEEEAAEGSAKGKESGDKKHRNVFQRAKDKMIGTKEERAEEHRLRVEAAKKQQAAYVARRQALIQQQRDHPELANYYAAPYDMYGPPLSPYGRGGFYPGYGYRGGYGGYGGYGYGGYGGMGYGGMGGMGLGMGAGLLGGAMVGGLLF